jgi:hypothetical protein
MNDRDRGVTIIIDKIFIYLILLSAILFIAWLLYSISAINKKVEQCASDVNIYLQMAEESRHQSDPAILVEKLVFMTSPSQLVARSEHTRTAFVSEVCRKMSIRLVIEELRRNTNHDLGDDPDEWIDRYRGGVKP